jgi:predicted DNA helicase
MDAGLNCVRIGRPFKIDSGLKAITLDNQIEHDKRYKEVTQLREEAFEKIKEQSAYTSPSPRWTRGMKNRDIHRLAARGKGSRGVSAQQMKSISAWIRIRESADAIFEKADQLEMDIIQHILKKADVVLATNSGAGISLLEGHTFDYVVIDEATQSTESSALIPAVKGKQLVLIGDHMQLPPTVISKEAQDKGLSVSLQERLVDRYGRQVTSLLNIQYRMNDRIMQFSNARFYEGELHSADGNKSWRLDLQAPSKAFKGAPWLKCATEYSAVFYDVGGREVVRGEGPSYENPDEAARLVQMVAFLCACGVQPGQIGIISPYKAQVYLLKEMLQEKGLYSEGAATESNLNAVAKPLQVDTVDGFQGREKDVILISLVRTGEKGIGFLQDTRRLNVALTRAKKLRVTFGSARGLSQYPVYDAFIAESVTCSTEKR